MNRLTFLYLTHTNASRHKKALQEILQGNFYWWKRVDSNHRSRSNRFTVCPLWPLGNSSIWSWWTDLNPRPADYKSAALPTELHQLELSFVLLIQATITVYHLSRILSSTFFRIYKMLIFINILYLCDKGRDMRVLYALKCNISCHTPDFHKNVTFICYYDYTDSLKERNGNYGGQKDTYC